MMNFQPVIPLSGYVGWRFLERTLEGQQKAFNDSAPVQRATTYFRENIVKIQNAQELVDDRRLLEVALGAFGLDDDINNRFFIQKILEDGTTAPDALANRLSDNRYAAFSQAFGFAEDVPLKTQTATFQNEIIDRYEARQFERAVGDQNNDLRLALNVETGISDILMRSGTQNGQWFSIMGNAPLRNVFEKALGLPSSLGRIDIDQQREAFQDRARSVFGTNDVADFADPDMQEKLIRLFLIRSEASASFSANASSTALTLLQSAPRLF